jgi:hypothetical protein
MVVFEGRLLPNSTTTVSLCPDQEQRGQMTIHDAAGQAHRYPDLLPFERLPARALSTAVLQGPGQSAAMWSARRSSARSRVGGVAAKHRRR